MSIPHSTTAVIPPPPSGTDLRSRALAALQAQREEQRQREEAQARHDLEERIRWIDFFARRMEIQHYEIGNDARSIIADGLRFSVAVYCGRPSFHILEPCVECHELAPHTAIDSLLDLGCYLEQSFAPVMCPSCARVAAEAEECEVAA